MERGDKINGNIWDLTAAEQWRITPEAIQCQAASRELILQAP